MILNRGEKVHYIPFDGCSVSEMENGVVKRMNNDGTAAFVVYNCNGEWDKIDNYTAASTSLTDLKLGWVEEARNWKFCIDAN